MRNGVVWMKPNPTRNSQILLRVYIYIYINLTTKWNQKQLKWMSCDIQPHKLYTPWHLQQTNKQTPIPRENVVETQDLQHLGRIKSYTMITSLPFTQSTTLHLVHPSQFFVGHKEFVVAYKHWRYKLSISLPHPPSLRLILVKLGSFRLDLRC